MLIAKLLGEVHLIFQVMLKVLQAQADYIPDRGWRH
jgi:hypothetical protein